MKKWEYDTLNRIIALKGWKAERGILRLEAATELGRTVTFLARPEIPGVWRVAVGAEAFVDSPMLVPREEPLPEWRLEEEEDRLLARSEGLSLCVGKKGWGLSFLDDSGRPVLHEALDDLNVLGDPKVLQPGFLLPKGRRTEGHFVTSFSLGLREKLFGLGERFLSMERSGQAIDLWNRDALCTTSDLAYKNIPFLWSTAGWGFFAHTSSRVGFEFRTRSALSWTVKAPGPFLEFFVILGPEPAAILERYTRLTGRPEMPPDWAFGLWLSGGGARRDRESVEEMAREARERKIPCDVIHVDTWWMRKRRYADFQWDEEAFPDPAGFVKGLRDQGFRVSLWEHPYISIESPLFQMAERRGFLVRDGKKRTLAVEYGLSLAPLPGKDEPGTGETWNAPAGIVDFTRPRAVEWYQELHRPLLDLGVSSFKTDFGEDLPEEAAFRDGKTGADLHNLYPLLYNKVVYETVRDAPGGGLVWGRSGWAGSQRYPACWGGDPRATFESLACALRGGLSLGVSGVPFWSVDIGGYWGEPDPELYVRWAQAGLFFPLARCHGEGRREPWAFGEEAEEIVRSYAELRYSLLPYILAMARKSSRTGVPLVRPLVFDWPLDFDAWSVEDQFLFGDFLMAAPVLERETQRRIYFPPGRWVEFFSGETLRGPGWTVYRAPLRVLPLFVRDGGILPMAGKGQRVEEVLDKPLLIHVYPPGEGESRVVLSDGRTELSCRVEEEGIFFRSGRLPRPGKLFFHRPYDVGKVLLDGKELEEGSAEEGRPGTYDFPFSTILCVPAFEGGEIDILY